MNPTRSPYLVPVAIILSGLVLAVAIYLVRIHAAQPVTAVSNPTLVRPVSTNDHILGSPTANVIVVEYSDIDCEYCKKAELVMEQVMTDYGTSGNVAWVYRHFPLLDSHPNAAEHAEAAECVASLGTPALFWRFIDAVQAAAPGASQFDPNNYGSIATSLGVSATALSSCRAGDTMMARVSADFSNALEIGADSTPYFVILTKGAAPVTISGYVPYESMKQAIDDALSKVGQ